MLPHFLEAVNMMRYHSSEHTSLHAKRDFTDVTEVPNQLTLKWRVYSKLSRWAQYNHRKS